MPRWTTSIFASLLFAFVLFAGCESSSLPSGEHRIYPFGAETAGDLDITVQRDGFWNANVTNRSARKMTNFTLWLNEHHGLVIESLSPGEQISVDLTQFTNRYGEIYRTGSYISPRKSQPIIKATIEQDKMIYRGIVILDKEWQKF